MPVQFGTKTEREPDGEDEEGKPKYKSVEVDNIINNTNPIWTKAPADLKDEDYLDFYRNYIPFRRTVVLDSPECGLSIPSYRSTVLP